MPAWKLFFVIVGAILTAHLITALILGAIFSGIMRDLRNVGPPLSNSEFEALSNEGAFVYDPAPDENKAAVK
jgi:hypothetical protein